MAQSLIEALSGDFDPTQYTDEYREALQSLIDAKVDGREVVAPAAAEADDGHRRRPDGGPARQRRGREGGESRCGDRVTPTATRCRPATTA